MIRELIERAKCDQSLCRGECLEVHIAPEGDSYGIIGRTELKTFIRDWLHLPGGEAIDCYQDRSEPIPDVRWLGVVHEDGVLFVPLDCESQFPCYTYQDSRKQ